MSKKEYEKQIFIKCPICGTLFKIPLENIPQGEFKCSKCGAVLTIAPKDPSLYLQSLLYKEMVMILRKIEKDLLGD